MQKLKSKQRNDRFSLEIHEDIRWNCATKVLATVATVLCLFRATITRMQEYNKVTARLDWNPAVQKVSCVTGNKECEMNKDLNFFLYMHMGACAYMCVYAYI